MSKGHNQKIPYDTLGLDGVGQWPVVMDAIVVAAAFANPGEGANLLEIGDDVLDRPFRDPDVGRAFAQAKVRIFMKEHQDMRVMGQEGPCRVAAAGL
jgi:hypothetical protein